MKFANSNALLAVGAFGAAANARVMSREASVIEGLLQSVFQSMANADNHVLQFQASGDVSALKQSGEDLISVIAAGVEKAQAMEPLQEEDVAAISPISQQLSAIGAKFLKDMGEAAPKFAAGGYCSHANQFVGHLSDVSNAFFEANKEKFPADSQEYAEKEIKTTDGNFAEALAALSPPYCVDAEQGAPEQGAPEQGAPEGAPEEGGAGGFGEGQGEQEPPKQEPPKQEPPKQEPPKEVPGAPTSIAWHTGAEPGKPTGAPECGSGGHGGNGHGNGHSNGTNSQPHVNKPKPQPVKGSGNVVAPSMAVAALLAVAGFALTL